MPLSTPLTSSTSKTAKSDASHDDLAAVQSVKVKTFGEDGLEQEVKLADKLRALDLLGKHLGMYKDTSEKAPAADALAKAKELLGGVDSAID